MNILLVDDEIELLETFAVLLAAADPTYNITQINNGKEAYEYIDNNFKRIDLVISDIKMDEVNGAQLAKFISEVNPNIRIILMSGYCSIIEQIKHFQLGVEKILNKPFDISELVSIIKNPMHKISMPLSSMMPVKIYSLLNAKKFPIDLYIQISDTKFLKMFPSKQTLDKQRLTQFVSQDVLFLYAKKDESFNLDFTFYLPTRVSTFKTSRVIPFNVFYFYEDEYKVLIPSGSILTEQMLAVIKKHELKVLYILDSDNTDFLNYLDLMLSDYVKDPQILPNDKVSATLNLVQSRTLEAYNNPNKDNIVNLKKSQTHLMKYLKDENNSIRELLKFNEADKGIHVHASMVASLSYALVLEIIAMRAHDEDKLKIKALDEYIFESDDIKEIIFTGALLHDLGKPILQVSHANADTSDKDSEINKMNMKHPQVAYDRLVELNVLHPKSLEIIIQHEEFCDGTGYPHKLKKTNIGFYAQIVILINYFDKIKRAKDINNHQAMIEIKNNIEKFNKHLIPILERILFHK